MTTQWFPFLLLCFAVELTPGPNMAYLAILTISAGRRAGFAAIGGIALGLATIGALAAVGVAELVSNSPLLSKLLAATGFCYLLWLAIDTWRMPANPSPAEAGVMLRHYFTRGIITNLLNPKAFLFYVTVLPGFIARDAGAVPHALLLTGISVAVATSIHIGIVLLASRAALYLVTPHRQQSARRVMALLLVAIALWFAFANF